MKPPDRLDITYLFYSLVLGWHHEAAEGFLGKVRTFRVCELARVAQIMFVLVADRKFQASLMKIRQIDYAHSIDQNRLSGLRYRTSMVTGQGSKFTRRGCVKEVRPVAGCVRSEVLTAIFPSKARPRTSAYRSCGLVTLLSIKQLTHSVFTSPVDGGASCCRDMKGIGSIPPLEVSDSGLQLGFPNVTFVDYMVTRRMSLNASWQKLPAAEYIWKLAQQPRALLSVTDCRVVFVYLLSRVALGMSTADAAVIDEDEEF
ncbi:hypothetical protein EV401DRAFT_1891296 [Pisolithus croceorrhizus]|nr:hypothetical protein EV401DRAFT_1891296 [Pisolithus croceorrhizus]